MTWQATPQPTPVQIVGWKNGIVILGIYSLEKEFEMLLPKKMLKLREQIRHRAVDDIERMINATKATGITPALIEAALRTGRILVVHSETWKEKLLAEHPKLLVKVISEVRGGDQVLIDNGINHLLLVETRALQRLCEDLLNYMEAKKIEDKP